MRFEWNYFRKLTLYYKESIQSSYLKTFTLDFVRSLNNLSQLYVTNSHVESLEPVVELVKVRRELFNLEEDIHKRLFMFIEGICIDTDCELDCSSLAEFAGFVSEIIINRKRIKKKHG